jgi:Coenzyme PQQ synthesis protein D (PqqD)
MFAMKAAKAPDVMIRQVGEESVILDLNTERYLGLDDVATRMWLALVASESVEQAYEKLRGVYRVDPETLRQDLEELVKKLVDYGLIRLEEK